LKETDIVSKLPYRACAALVGCILALALPAAARTWVVAQSHPAAADSNPATEDQPLKTIQAGADHAEPGDIVLVHAGTYRERVAPPRGGDAEDRRIVYRAAASEPVAIKGSDRITDWKKDNRSGLWLAEFDNARFGDYNPYALTINGEWLDYGEWRHRGDVYFEGIAYSEKRNLSETQKARDSWYCLVENGKTRIWANFGDADPNKSLAEINVRHTVFFPEQRGLKFITVDGFTIAHSAENWGPPGTRNGDGQWGAIGPRWGYGWIIENCTVINAKCIGITLGVVPGGRTTDINSFGHHIVRNNHVLRCGQAGIAGDSGAAASLIEHNLVEYTNDRGLYGGAETAGIKFHFALDAVIRGNTVRGVGSGEGYSGYGIWLDFGNQNTRVTGNVICRTQGGCMLIEASHGPVLVDNNVFIGNDVFAASESQIFVHNLFYHASVMWSVDPRRPPIWEPHSFKRAGSQTITPRDDKWYGNIFIGGGLHLAPEGPGIAIDYNVYLDGARKSRYDQHSVVDSAPADFNCYADRNLIAVDFRVPKDALAVQCPKIASAMLGKFPVSGMMIENPDGSPIEIANDFFGKPRKSEPGVPGPFQDVAAGMNSFTVWSTVTGPARPYRITVSPTDAAVKPGATQQFTALVWDQYGKPAMPEGGLAWEVAGGGKIDSAGLFTAGDAEGGPWRVTAKLPGQKTPVGGADVWVCKETPGLAYAYYEGAWRGLPDFAALQPVKTGTVPNFDIGLAQREDEFAVHFDGRINIPAAGDYTFFVNADDGAKLYIDGDPVVDNDGGHAVKEVQGTVELTAGMHTLALAYYEGRVQQYLTVEWQGPGFTRQAIPASVLFGPRKK
jgi:alpha-N-arabinofuranosidase